MWLVAPPWQHAKAVGACFVNGANQERGSRSAPLPLLRATLRDGRPDIPGRFGSVILSQGPDHRWFYRECLFERIRASPFPERPSRMRSAFAFESYQQAASWCSENPDTDHLYLVGLADAARPSFRADTSFLTTIRRRRTCDEVEEWIEMYWRGVIYEPEAVEVLTEGELVVRDRLT
jgi:hypothetical protein